MTFQINTESIGGGNRSEMGDKKVAECKVDIEAAQEMLETVKLWGFQPEVKDKLAKATEAAENSLLGLIVTGVKVGYWSNTPESNQFLLDKLRIAFQMGYYSRSVKGGKCAN